MITPVLGLVARQGSGQGQGILSVVRQLRHLQHAKAYLSCCLLLRVHRALDCLAAMWDGSREFLAHFKF